ncbi:MAG: glycosyltransferase family 2 protein [Opitutaceae bacterium]|jgi:glycosyltransferase involved in cell wall biosynthesis|nr:glycosyltransferase family 2 protein [Opitutaceae bacterium]
MKRLSLLVPCHNAERFIAPFLAMVAKQTRPYDEVIFYDDASTDGTASRLEEAGQRVIRGTVNRGAAHARNRLLEAASCEYVHFHDVDDRLDPDLARALLKEAGPGRVSFCAYRRVWEGASEAREDRFADLPRGEERVGYFLERFVTFNAMVCPRETLRRLGGFKEFLRIHEDLHFLLRLAASDLEFVYTDHVLTEWRLRPSSTFHAVAADRVSRLKVKCLADLAARWPAELRRQLGPSALALAWQMRLRGDLAPARSAAMLAEYCGVDHIADRGARLRWVSRVLGVSLALDWLSLKSGTEAGEVR